MSSIGKICCVVAVICSLIAAVLGFMVAKKKSAFSGQLDAVEQTVGKFPGVSYTVGTFRNNENEPAGALGRAANNARTTSEELAKNKEELTAAKVKLADVEAQVQKLTTDFTAAKRDLDEKATALTKIEEDFKTASAELKNLKDQLGGRSIDDMVRDLNDAVKQAETLTREKKIIDDALAKANTEIDRFRQLEAHRTAGTAPMEMSGRVVAINNTWNFVVLDVGKNNKLVENIELTVYRGTQLVGKVRTVSVEANAAIADIIPDMTPGTIQVGDKVLF